MYGTLMEPVAKDDYVQYQVNNGHPGLTTESVGLVVSVQTPWLAASPDGRVHDPTAVPPNGLVEYKNPHSARNMTLSQACQSN